MQNIYIIKLDEKYFSKLLKYHIYINKIKKRKGYYLLYLDYDNYQKLLKFKKIYQIELVGYKGLIKYEKILKKHYLFLIISVLGLLYLIFLSNLIFEIDIKTNDKELKNLLQKELETNNISLYKKVKSFSLKEEIKKKILENNKDKLEWMEITRVGSKYVIEVEKRIKNNEEIDNTPRNIVALKNAIILSIEAKRGSIVKKLNDYVKKGEVIVSGEITHKEEIVDLVRADATIYGETWYNVHVSYPISYYEKTYSGKVKKRLSLEILSKKFNFFDKEKYKDEEIKETKLLYHKFLPYKLSLETVYEVLEIDDIYTVEEASNKALEVARKKILKALPADSRILSQKKLKIIVNDSTIDVDVFFKVYENITATSIIEVKGD